MFLLIINNYLKCKDTKKKWIGGKKLIKNELTKRG
jgi:hypothetical protein